jgi:predicted RNA-binding protein Jag
VFLVKSDSIKDAVNSFVNFLEEEHKEEQKAEQKNVIALKAKASKDEDVHKNKTTTEKLPEIHGNGFERLTDIVKKTIEIIAMDKEIRVEPDKEKYRIAVYGKDLAIVIGKNGMGMDALEYLINLIGKRKRLVDKNVVLDIKDYRKRNDEKIKEIAINMAKKALKERKTIALRPMPSHERKIVHNILSKVKNIRTKSRDDEPNRRIVIYPIIKE